MITLQGKYDRNINIACSGGVDSMAATDFFSRKHNCNLIFFDHATDASRDAKELLQDYVSDKNSVFRSTPDATTLTFQTSTIQRKKEKSESWEEYWRNERYSCFHSIGENVITCHHLDDCVETWIWSSLHGNGKLIPFRNKNVVRPFRLNRKTQFVNWCRRFSVPWAEDASNVDTKYMRNYIRKELIDKCLVVNPGLHKVIQKKIRKEDVNDL